MNTIDINLSATFSTSQTVISTIEWMGGASCVKSIRLNTIGEIYEDTLPENYPLIITIAPRCRDMFGEIKIRCNTLTSGYGGSGPSDLYKIIKACGFQDIISWEDVSTKRYDKKEFIK